MSMHKEIERFRAWAASLRVKACPGEWGCDYSEWDAMCKAVLAFLASSSLPDWDDAEVRDLLYAIARDNESEYLAAEVATDAERLFKLVV